MFNPIKYFRNRMVGLVLGSGGAKGVSHISVIECLESMKIPIGMISGSSIGSVVGALYAAGKLREFKEELLRMNWKEMVPLFDPVFPRSGFFEGGKIIGYLTRFIPEDTKIQDLEIPLAIVATDFHSGKPVIFRSGRVLEALRASMSIPGVFVPMKYRDSLLVDGGVANALPIDIVKNMGAGITIAVNLHPPIYKRKLKSMVRGKHVDMDSADLELIKTGGEHAVAEDGEEKKEKKWWGMLDRWMEKKSENDKIKLPSVFEVITRSLDIMEYVNTELMLKYNPPTVLIEPAVSDIGVLEFTQAERILEEGRQACERARYALIRKVKIWI